MSKKTTITISGIIDTCDHQPFKYTGIVKEKCKKFLQSLYKENLSLFREKVNRPDWDNYLISLAYLASTRSMDAQTQCGCVITDQKHRILGVGYNSFPAGMNDWELPNLRPLKYDWMRHSERNALDQCQEKCQQGKCYVTGMPCLRCAQDLHGAGISEIVMCEHDIKMVDEDMQAKFSYFVDQVGIKVKKIEANFNHLKNLVYKLGVVE